MTTAATPGPVSGVLDGLGLPGHLSLVDLVVAFLVLVATGFLVGELRARRRLVRAAAGRPGSRPRRRAGAHRARPGRSQGGAHGRRPVPRTTVPWGTEWLTGPGSGTTRRPAVRVVGVPDAARPDTVTAGRRPG